MSKKPPAPLRAQTASEIAENEAVMERYRARRPVVPMVTSVAGGKVTRGPDIDDPDAYIFRVADVCGTNSGQWMDLLLRQLINAGAGGDAARGAESLQAGLAFLNGLAPANEVEAALGAQMFAMHSMAMAMAGRAEQASMTDHVRHYASIANKSSRTFAALAEALVKVRSGGKQQVEVRHVYVHGDAILGDVHTHAAPGGLGENRGQPLEPVALAFSPGPTMPGFDQARDALPVASADRQAEVSASRRAEPRRTEGPGERELSPRVLDEGSGRGAPAGVGQHRAREGEPEGRLKRRAGRLAASLQSEPE